VVIHASDSGVHGAREFAATASGVQSLENSIDGCPFLVPTLDALRASVELVPILE